MPEKLIISDSFRAMGTNISLKIVWSGKVNDKKLEKIKIEVRNTFEKSEKIFSRFRENSELSKINKKLGIKTKISSEMLEILLLCKKFNKISGGYFDPRILKNLEKIGYKKNFKKNNFVSSGEEIILNKTEGLLENDLKIFSKEKKILIKKEVDTTGIVKGWTVDLVSKFLLKEGFKNFIIDAGGDMSIQGLNGNCEKWKIGIEDVDDTKIMLECSRIGLATSGINRKQWVVGEKKVHHLINPKDPNRFSLDLKTVTVIREKTVEADGRAKTLYLMGREDGLKFANENKIEALFLDYKGNVYLSEEIKQYIV